MYVADGCMYVCAIHQQYGLYNKISYYKIDHFICTYIKTHTHTHTCTMVEQI